MEAVERASERVPAVGAVRLDPAALAAWLLPLLLILYLALNDGGYGAIERGEAGVAVWWMVLVGTAVGALPAAGGTRRGRAMLALLAAFAAWTALSLGWTESDERTATELARVATYLGVFALALAVQGQGRWRHLLHGATTGVAVVCALAVLSRLEPGWFPDRLTGDFLPGIEIESRLAYPLNYSSGLGALAAISLPLLLAATSSARMLIAQALAAAALPIAALALWLTTSSLSVPAAAIALLAFLVLAPDRLPKLGTLAIAGAGSGVLFAALEQRDALGRGVPNAAALEQGDEMKAIVLVVCAGVALAQTGLGLAVRYGRRPGWLRIPRETASVASIAAVAAIAIVGLAAGLPGQLSDAWEEFKDRGGAGPAEATRAEQILDVSSSGRYEFWRSAADANATDPWQGIGPGTFEFWWAREGSYTGFVRDAHSLYLETLGELGIVGLALIGGFGIAALAIGAARALRAPPELRLAIAAATAACAAFLATATVDWVWELGVLPVLFFLVAAVVVAAGAEAPKRRTRSRRCERGPLAPARRNWDRIALGALSVAALFAIATHLAGAEAIEQSRERAARGELQAALADARDAQALQPYAAGPLLQQALVLERLGVVGAAAAAAREATDREPTNWRNWLVLSRLEARSGDAGAAVAAFERGRELNPKSVIFSVSE